MNSHQFTSILINSDQIPINVHIMSTLHIDQILIKVSTIAFENQSDSKRLKASQSDSQRLKATQSDSQRLKVTQRDSKRLKATQSDPKRPKVTQSDSKRL